LFGCKWSLLNGTIKGVIELLALLANDILKALRTAVIYLTIVIV
jgi:hypothetical protein